MEYVYNPLGQLIRELRTQTLKLAIEYFKGKYSDLAENVSVCLCNRINISQRGFWYPYKKGKEWDDMTDYARRYFNLVDSYRVIWWKHFNCTESGNWTNILALVALLFCLPASNGKVEMISLC